MLSWKCGKPSCGGGAASSVEHMTVVCDREPGFLETRAKGEVISDGLEANRLARRALAAGRRGNSGRAGKSAQVRSRSGGAKPSRSETSRNALLPLSWLVAMVNATICTRAEKCVVAFSWETKLSLLHDAHEPRVLKLVCGAAWRVPPVVGPSWTG